MPTNQSAEISVDYLWNGSSSLQVEQEVTSKLEQSFNSIEGINKITSKSFEGRGKITISFDKNVDINLARLKVATQLRFIYNRLPKGITYPRVSINNINEEMPEYFLSYSIQNPSVTPFQINKTVNEQILPKLDKIKNVEIDVYGANPMEYIFKYDQNLLDLLKIDKDDLVQQLNTIFHKQSLSFSSKLGFIKVIQINNSNFDPNWHIPIKKLETKLIYLDEILSISKKEQKAQSYYRVNGENSINISFRASSRANIIVLEKMISEKIFNIKSELPSNYTLSKSYDTTTLIKNEISLTFNRAIYTMLLLLLSIWIINRNLKYLYIIFISLTVNICISFIFYFLFEVQIHFYSIAGLIISLGLCVTNYIIINKDNESNQKNTLVSVLASNLITIGTLSVVFFLDDKYKSSVVDFALVIIINLVISIVISFYLIPYLKISFSVKNVHSQFSIHVRGNYRKIVAASISNRRFILFVVVISFGFPLFLLPEKLETSDAFLNKTYNTTFGNDIYQNKIRVHLDRYLGGSFRLFHKYVTENPFPIKTNEPKLIIDAVMGKGGSVEDMNDVFMMLETHLQSHTENIQFTSNIYSKDFGRIEIVFKNKSATTAFATQLKETIIDKVIDLGGVEWNVYGIGLGFDNNSGDYKSVKLPIEAKGYNYGILNNYCDTLRNKLLRLPHFSSVTIQENSYWRKKEAYEYTFYLDKEKLALFDNGNPKDIFNQLKDSDLSNHYDLLLNVNNEYSLVRFENRNLRKENLFTLANKSSGTSISKLSNIISINKSKIDETIYKENQEYIRIVDIEYTGEKNYGKKIINRELKQLNLPMGYTLKFKEKNDFDEVKENINYLLLLFLIVLIIYIICAILFESLLQPILIISMIPFSFIGVFLIFYFTNTSFDQGGLASFIFLSGITVNTSLLIVNRFNKLSKTAVRVSKMDLYIKAVQEMIFPIFTITLSMIASFIPFIINGGEVFFWNAFGIGVIGGLVFSIIGVLFFLPIISVRKIN